MLGAITDVPGLRAGHYTDREAITGCTVVICEAGAVGGVDVRGSSPGTRETDLLRPTAQVQQVHAILLSGGSAFGLDAATGVVRYLEERGIGYDARGIRVPIVPAAILFDLRIGSSRVRPDAAAGYAACQMAVAGRIEEGSVGAGTGATVGKVLGMGGATKGGVGTSSLELPGGIVVAALVAVNAVGDVVDPATGRVVAGVRGPDGYVGAVRLLLGGPQEGPAVDVAPGTNTTIGVVATNARLTKEGANKVAQMAHDGLALAIRPAHTAHDGDAMFALATGQLPVDADLSVVGAAAAEVVARAISRAVTEAISLGGIPAARDLTDEGRVRRTGCTG